MKRQSQQGIALVITLILLSVITFMAVTFLVVSRHEGEQVDTFSQQNASRMSAEGIEQMAVAQIIAQMMAATNGLTNLGLIVSTNFVTPTGYDPSTAGTPPIRTSLTNVNYFYNTVSGGGPLSLADQQQMMNNLQFLPRAPVFISTNKNQLNPEFRFYLDENGNGMFETNGLVTNTDVQGRLVQVGGVYQTSIQVGDPEWVGFLEHPDQRHSASNLFLGRGAFIAVPSGDGLDANYIHNQSRLSAPIMKANSPEAYYRNQGVTPGEISLAAFLAAVNTNVWGWQTNAGGGLYSYATDPNGTSTGTAFLDAATVMQYRNSGNYFNLSSFSHLYGNPAVVNYLVNGAVDAYAVGPLMTNINPPTVPVLLMSTYAGNPWSGADNPVKLMRPRDLMTLIPALNASTPLDSFTNRLSSIGHALDTYDRYTFYRILAQMGFSSAPEPTAYPIGGGYQPRISQTVATLPAGMPIGGRNQMSSGTIPEPYPYVHSRKMNLNFNNLTSTNFGTWVSPAQFFTNAADRMLRTYFPNNFAVVLNGTTVVTNINIGFIPVYPVNYYTPSVHRLLQLAANIYDASTNKNTGVNGIDYPTVFRPYFGKATSVSGSTIVFIAGYTNVEPTGGNLLPANCLKQPLDLRRPADLAQVEGGFDMDNNIYGVPYVIGVKTNLPNFNQFTMASVVQVTRALMLTNNGVQTFTNVSYAIGVSNIVGVQCWNAYSSFFNRPSGIKIIGTDDFSIGVSNSFNGVPTNINMVYGLQGAFASVITSWSPGVNVLGTPMTTTAGYALPILTNTIALSNNYYLRPDGNYSLTPLFMPLASNQITGSFYPDWTIHMTNRLRLIIQDVATGRILDYVQLGGLGQLGGPDGTEDVVTNLGAISASGPDVWNTSPVSAKNPLPIGLNNQIAISESYTLAQKYQSYWALSPGGSSFNNVGQGTTNFAAWLVHPIPNTSIQAPFAMTVGYSRRYSWSANDPLVHYMTGDLTDLTQSLTPTNGLQSVQPGTNLATTNLLYPHGFLSARYQPWNTTVATSAQLSSIKTANQVPYRDPWIHKASDWAFPLNKYPNVGWLGRVHRGTPWQTVYLKSQQPDLTTNAVTHLTTWQLWTGNPDAGDAANMQPTSDLSLLDLFTTAPNDNASRGQLSVNQTNAEAWAAVLDDVMVLSNSTKGLVATNIDIRQSNLLYGNLVQYLISAMNTNRSNSFGHVFSSVGQLLSTPALTVASPYINTNGAYYNDTNLTDAVFERIPQQIASLVRVGTPRYEIYAYGQSLKPADKSIVQSGQFFGMCTNYQITGEVLTRTVVRFDNMPVPGQPPPGTLITYALPIQGASASSPPVGYAIITNTIPPVRAVVESFTVLGPDQ